MERFELPVSEDTVSVGGSIDYLGDPIVAQYSPAQVHILLQRLSEKFLCFLLCFLIVAL
jgi:hypothetical protein